MKNFILFISLTTALLFNISTAKSQIVTEKIWVTVNSINDLPNQEDGKLVSANQELQQLIEEFHIQSFDQALFNSKREDLLKVYEIECFCDVLDLEKRIVETSNVLSNPQPAPEYDFMADPDDYLAIFPNDYALDLIKARGAWNYTNGDTSIILGVSDGNFFLAHEELENEFVSVDVPTSTPSYYYNHGTAVAATAGGKTNNSQGKSSIGYNCRLALAGMGYNYIMQLSNDGVPVINMSWASGCSYNAYLQTLINEMYDNGTILVAAAGNGGTCGGPTNLVYPAAFDHVISVTSIGEEDNHEKTIGDPTTTHQHNSTVDLAAPGYLVGITVAPGYYIYGNGTSFAAPYVTGTIGLMLSVAPCLTYEEVEKILKETAVNIDAQNPDYIGGLGAGRLDAEAAVLMATSFCTTDTEGSPTIEIDTLNYNVADATENPDQETSTTSQVAELDSEDNMSFDPQLYPNPTLGEEIITWDIDQHTVISVVNLLGEVILKKEVNSGTTSMKLNFPNPGVYLVSLEQAGQKKWSGKIVKM